MKPANLAGGLTSRSFAVTDSNYGVTAAIYRCDGCGFLECPELPDVVPYYEALEDDAYEQGRSPRSLQARKILERIRPHRPSGRLLDVGAGTGMLVEVAVQMGYDAEGVEPCLSFQRQAAERGLRVHVGTFPSPSCPGPYDVVTLIDVIEHVSNPVDLLVAARNVLAPDGVVALVTPDVRSVAARVLGWRWWHFRVAHIGYFDRSTLALALGSAGLVPVALSRPSWYLPAGYIYERLWKLLLAKRRVAAPRILDRVTLPLNLWDSLQVIARREPAPR